MASLLQSLTGSLPEQVRPVATGDQIVVIDEQDPITFWSRFTGALRHARCIALLDPQWPEHWKNRYAELADREWQGDPCRILIPTSGTTDNPKFCIHTLDTLQFAADAFARRFAHTGIIHCLNVLPQHHVGGLMPVFRAAAAGGKTVFANYMDDFGQASFGFPLENASLSLVPTQLARILTAQSPASGLQHIGMILIGGAACPAQVMQHARAQCLRLAPCYGSTETAALVTILEPERFIMGNSSVGTALPGMEIRIDPDQVIEIHSGSVHTGYIPADALFNRSPYRTSDLGRFDSEGNLHILGRADDVIITGGKKVIPAQVESVCLASGHVADAQCHGVRDPDWGTRVELSVVFTNSDKTRISSLLSFLKEHLPAYAVPKQIHAVDSIARNSMGKRIPPSA